MKTTSVMIVGVGGQGSLLASRLLGTLLTDEGYDVKVSEVHGMSQRGGSVVTYVRFGDKVYSPIVTEGECDFIISFEKLEAEGVIQKTAVEGIRFPMYFLTEDLPLVEAVLSDAIDLRYRLEFLAPLDPMLWDRKLVEAIWDYQYSWEI